MAIVLFVCQYVHSAFHPSARCHALPVPPFSFHLLRNISPVHSFGCAMRQVMNNVTCEEQKDPDSSLRTESQIVAEALHEVGSCCMKGEERSGLLRQLEGRGFYFTDLRIASKRTRPLTPPPIQCSSFGNNKFEHTI